MCGVKESIYPASSMENTVKNFLLIFTTTDLGAMAGISLVMSSHNLHESGTHRAVPKAERKQESCEGCWYSEGAGAQSKESATLRQIKTDFCEG